MADAKHAKPPQSRRSRRRARKAARDLDPAHLDGFDRDIDGLDEIASFETGPDAEHTGDDAAGPSGASALAAGGSDDEGRRGEAGQVAAVGTGDPDGADPDGADPDGADPDPVGSAGTGDQAEDLDRDEFERLYPATAPPPADPPPDTSEPRWTDRPDSADRSGEAAPEGDHGGGGHGTGAVIAALLANAAVAVAKFVGWLVTGSSSMLAESVHSVADSGNQGLLLLGGRRARQAADQEHPFGYGRERYFWGFVVALVLFTLGSLFAIYEAIHKIENPEPVEGPQWALGILAFAMVAEGLSFRKAVKQASQVKGKASYWQFVRRAKSPELPVVLMEDFAALMGLVFAIIGVTAATVTDDGIWDGYGTLAIGILLGVVAIILVIEMKSLLIGESASRKDMESIRSAVEVEPTVVGMIHMRAEHIGPEELLVGTKVEFQHDLTVVEVSAAINRLERSIRTGVPSARIIYVEPDVNQDHKDLQGFAGYVPEHAGHIDPHDPKYAAITGQHRAIVIDDGGGDDDDIWS